VQLIRVSCCLHEEAKDSTTLCSRSELRCTQDYQQWQERDSGDPCIRRDDTLMYDSRIRCCLHTVGSTITLSAGLPAHRPLLCEMHPGRRACTQLCKILLNFACEYYRSLSAVLKFRSRKLSPYSG
jgi:hypothetical protein